MTNNANSVRNTIIGSILIFIGQLLFATNDALIKLSDLEISQLLIGRFGIQFTIAILWWIFHKPPNAIHWYGDKPYIANIWFRGITYSITIVCLWYGIIRLPLGDASCIFHQAPIVIAIIAAVALKEELPKLTPLIVILAAFGVTLLAQPTFITSAYYNVFDKNNPNAQLTNIAVIEPLHIDGIISTIIAVIAWSISVVLTRTAKDLHFIQLEIVSAGQTVFVSVPILLTLNQFIFQNEKIGNFDIQNWRFDMEAILIMVVIGIFGFGALSLNVIGFQYGEATKVAWLEYVTILFTFQYQIFLFHDVPNGFEIFGAILVIIACSLSVIEEAYNHYRLKREHQFENIAQTTSSYESGYDDSDGENLDFDLDA